jgi:hypothetical protein
LKLILIMYSAKKFSITKYSIIPLLLFIQLFVYGQQSPVIVWDKTFGGSDFDDPYSIQQTTDGGYIIVGISESTDGDISDENNGGNDCWVVKLDQSGNKVWDKTLGGEFSDEANSIQQTSDGGYIIAGTKEYQNGLNPDFDAWVVKLNANGSTVWDKTFGGSKSDHFSSIQQTADGNYVAAGYTKSSDGDISAGNNSNGDCWIVKLDDAGAIVWDKKFGGSEIDYTYSIQPTSDGGYVFAGLTFSNDGDISDGNNGDSDCWIVKLDQLGNKVWDKTLGGSYEDAAFSIQQTSDGGYVFAGYVDAGDGDVSGVFNGDYDCWVVKLDQSGAKLWDKTFGGSDLDEAHFVQQTSDGGYIVAGFTYSEDGDINGRNNGELDSWILRLDGSGAKVWDKVFGGSSYDGAISIQQNTDGDYVAACTSESDDGDITNGNNGYSDFWIVKLKEESSQVVNQIKHNNDFSLFPNPTFGEVFIKTNSLKYLGKVKITDMTGKIIKQLESNKMTLEINVSDFENGVYFIEAGDFTKKFVKK